MNIKELLAALVMTGASLQMQQETLTKFQVELDTVAAKYPDKDAPMSDEDDAYCDELLAAIDTAKETVAKTKRTSSLRQSIADERSSRSQGLGRRTTPSSPGQRPGAGSDVIGHVQDRRELDPMAGYPSLEEGGGVLFAKDVLASVVGQTPERLLESMEIMGAATTFAQEGVGVDGGFLVPAEMRNEIWKYAFETDGVLTRMTIEPTNSNSVMINRDETTPWGSTGVRAEWLKEGATFTQRKPVFGQDRIELNKVGCLVPATDELLEDAPRLSNHLTQKAGEAINWVVSDSIINGIGGGQPLGIINSGAVVTQAKETSQTADTINVANAVKMRGRLIKAGGLGGAFWAINPDAWNQLPQMTIGNHPVFTSPNSGVKETPSGSLLGIEVLETESCQTLGDLNDLILINPRGYFAAQKQGGIKFAMSIHLWFDTDTTAFKWTIRIGGTPYASGPITPPNSAITQSHFINLAARA